MNQNRKFVQNCEEQFIAVSEVSFEHLPHYGNLHNLSSIASIMYLRS